MPPNTSSLHYNRKSQCTRAAGRRVLQFQWRQCHQHRHSHHRSLTRNQQLNRVALLLVPPPPPLQRQRQQQQEQQERQRQQQHATSRMMRKISHNAIAKFATVGSDNNAGTSAIFKLFQVRPALLEKRIKGAAAAAAPTAGGSPTTSNRRSIEDGGGAHTDINSIVAAKKASAPTACLFF
jgi:hypothetical protein